MLSEKIEKIASDLAPRMKGQVLVDIFSRILFSTDASIYQIIPLCVVRPFDADDVACVVKYARRNHIPVAGRGAGTGVAGDSLTDGIVIDFRSMNHIIGTERNGEVVICQPGVVLDDLNKYLAPAGRKIGPDPSSGNRAMLGGVVANNATGAHSLMYGYIADYIEWLELVTADGVIVKLTGDFQPDDKSNDPVNIIAEKCLNLLKGRDDIIAAAQPKTTRNRCGYNIAGLCLGEKVNLAGLMAGSEGTLGVFTKIALRTVELPAAKGIIQFEFESFDKMAQAVPVIVKTGAAACELMDRTLIDMARLALPEYQDILPAGCAAILLVEHFGQDAAEVEEKILRTRHAVETLTVCGTIFLKPAEQARLWKSRKDAVPLLNRTRGDLHPVPFVEDVSVENTRLAEYIAGLKKIGGRFSVPMVFYGHAGDGELHIRPYLDLSKPADRDRMQTIAQDVFELAWSLGGSISGEHAVGIVRAPFVERQYGKDYCQLLRSIKNIFDPDGILNPGKIITSDTGVMVRNLRFCPPNPDHVLTTGGLSPDEFRREIGSCDGCGLCLSTDACGRMCPVFRATGDEQACSRAKVNLLRAWLNGLISNDDFESDDFREILDLCINCGMCSIQCPAGLDVGRLVRQVRAELTERRGLNRTKTLLAHSRRMSQLASFFVPFSNIPNKTASFRWLLEKFTGLDRRRQMPLFEPKPFLKIAGQFLASNAMIAEPLDKVAYFVDSFVNYNNHRLGFAVLKCLRHNNIDVFLPPQRPVPLPAIVYGDLKTAKDDIAYIAGHLADAVSAGFRIVCSEPSAALFLKTELKSGVSDSRADIVSDNTSELMSYLNTLYKQGRLKSATLKEQLNFAYHSPCHLCLLGSSGASVELLSSAIGAKITDVNAGCCGIAGTFGMQKKNYDLSYKIAAPLVRAFEAADADIILTECSTCRMQIEHLTSRKVLHPVEVLALAYGLMYDDSH